MDWTTTTGHAHWEIIEDSKTDLLSNQPIMLSASDFNAPPVDENPNAFNLLDKPRWSKQEYTLPIKIKFGVTFKKPGAFNPCWS